MYLKPIVNYQFIVPTTVHKNHGKDCHVYQFYHTDSFKNYLENEDQHPVDKSRAYAGFTEYMFEHYTKEEQNSMNHIQTFTNKPKKADGKADNTIIYHTFISLDDTTTSIGGFGTDRDRERVCKFFFNEMMRHHRYNPKDWCYFAAEHTNTDHAHLHILIYQPNTVSKERIVDWTKKENCMTSTWVRTNTVKYIMSILPAYVFNQTQEVYNMKRLIEAGFKKEVSQSTFKPAIKSLAREINAIKGYEGRLQYNQLLKFARQTQEQEKKLSKSKEKWIPAQDAKILINKIDALSEYVIKSNKELSKNMDEIENRIDKAFDENSKDKEFSVFYKDRFKEQFHDELYAFFGNRILTIVKDNISSRMWIMSKDYRINYKYLPEEFQFKQFKYAKDCRTYQFNIANGITKAGKQLEHDFFQMLRACKNSDLEEYAHNLRAEEEMMVDLMKEENGGVIRKNELER